MGTATDVQNEILTYLSRRISGGEERYCTISTIKKNTRVDGSNQYILALTDDLEIQGFITTRQSYQQAGGRLFQITAAGIDTVEAGTFGSVNSSDWTGRIDVSQTKLAQIREKIGEIRSFIDVAELSNKQKANALAIVDATEALVDAPDPQWPEILRLLRSPILSNITSLAGLLFSVITSIMTD